PPFESKLKYYPGSPNKNQILHKSFTIFPKKSCNGGKDYLQIPHFFYTRCINSETGVGIVFFFEVTLEYGSSQHPESKRKILLSKVQVLSI
ncbi:hypothetical protein PanWU01x14_364790, partial [Parasponia andersonii]